MRKIQAKNGKLYKVPVILVISDASEIRQREIFERAFFEAVHWTYGVGWGRIIPWAVYVDEWNTDVFGRIRGGGSIYDEQVAYPVGKAYRDDFAELQEAAAEQYPLPSEENGVPFYTLLRQRKYVLEHAPQSGFPQLISLQYLPTATLHHDVSAAEQWKLIEFMIKQFNKKQKVVDAVFIDNDHYGLHDKCSYDARSVPPILADIPAQVFNSAKHLIDLLIKSKVFHSVEEFAP